MKRFDHIIIASDLDGTFLNANGGVVPRNLEAIRYFTENGGHFTFSTGRTADIILPRIPMAPTLLNLPAVTGNGTCLYDFAEKKASCEYLLPYEILKELGDFFATEAPDLAMRASTQTGLAAYDLDNPRIRSEYERNRDQYEIVPFADWDKLGVYKLAVRGNPERLQELYPTFEKRWGDRTQLALSWNDLLDIQLGGRTKAVMLRELIAARFDTPTVLCAVGDYENDLEMLRMADLAACPDNAIDAVKAVCPLHFCSNNEGVIGDLVEYLDTHDVAPMATRK